MLKYFLPAYSLFFIFVKHSNNEINKILRSTTILGNFQLPNFQLFEILRNISILSSLIKERILPFKCHPIQNNSQRKHIDLGVSFLILRNLRSHIYRSSFNRDIVNDIRVSNKFGKSKISNFKISIMNQDIFRLDISMDQTPLVKHLVTLAELFQEEPYFFFRNAVFAFVHVLVQITTVTVLHDQVQIFLAGYLDLLVMHQVWMVWQLFKNLKLSLVNSTVLLFIHRNYLGNQFFLQILKIIGFYN